MWRRLPSDETDRVHARTARGASRKDCSMNRFVRIPLTLIVCVAWAGFALAQATPPATAGAPPQAGGQSGAPSAAPQGPGRGGFVPVPVVIGPPAPVPPEVAIPRPTSAELAQVNDAVRKFIDADTSSTQTAAEEVRIAVDAAAAAPERRRHLHADGAAAGAAARGVRRDREAREHRSAAARRLDHRLVGAGRREQGDVRQVLRRHPDGEFRGRRRHDAGRAVGAQERRRPGVSAEGRHADDRHEQQRREHRT